jgi:hypothetical protein
MFVYCFDLEEKNKLQQSLKLFKESNIDNKQCWIFFIDKEKKFNFSEIDKSKCVISDRMIF